MLIAYQINEQLLGTPMVRYSIAGKPFTANQVSPLEVKVESLSNRETNFNLIITAANASLIADGQNSIQVNSTAIKIPISLHKIHEELSFKVHFQMDKNTTGCAFDTAIEPAKSRPLVTSSIEGAKSVYNNQTKKYSLEAIYGPSI